MNLGDRIRQARKVAGMTQTQLADASGMSQQMISKLESGGSPATSNIVAIAMALNVSAEWLDSGEKKLEPTEPGPEFVPIERVKLKVSAGVTGFTVEHLDGNGPPVYYRADWLKEEGLRAERLFALRVSGDSMQPSLWDGDLIVVNTEDTEPRDGRVYVFNYEGEAVIKRLERDAGEWWLTSDNPLHKRKKANEVAIIVGRVIYKQSKVV